VRDIVVGLSDGLTVPLALAAGLSGAVDATRIMVTAGLAEIAAGAPAPVPMSDGPSKGRRTRRLTMATVLGGRQTVPREDVVLAQAVQLEARLNVLERRGVVWKAEVLAEITWLREQSVKIR